MILMRREINAVIIRNGCILLVRRKKTWILPGGKPKTKESDIECLSRELKEKLQISLKNLRRLGDEFIGITPHKGDTIYLRVYLAEIEGKIIPSAEIEVVQWTITPENYRISDITKKVICFLRRNGYL